MKKEEILQKLKEIFVLVVNRDADVSSITCESKIIQDLGVSSVGLIYLMVAVEETFNEFGLEFNNYIEIDDSYHGTYEIAKEIINNLGIEVPQSIKDKLSK